MDHTKGIFKTQANNVINDISNCVTNNFSNSVVNNTIPLFTIFLSNSKFSPKMWDLDFKGTKHMISKQKWFTIDIGKVLVKLTFEFRMKIITCVGIVKYCWWENQPKMI